MKTKYDAIVIGSGPNGFAAAIELAKANLSVALFEAKGTVGGGMRSGELTLPHFIHDICSAIHPLAISSPFFNKLSLESHGVEWIQPPSPLAHPFDNGSAAVLERSVERTCHALAKDAQAYKKLMEPFIENWTELSSDLLAPLHFPKHPFQMAKFGFLGLRSAEGLCQEKFEEDQTKSLFLGMAAHSFLPLTRPLSAAFGLILAILGHVKGWPIVKGGSQLIASGLEFVFRSLGGEIYTNETIKNIDTLPPSKVIVCDVTPRQLLKMAGHRLSESYKNQLERYRYGPGVFKVDWALNAPIPWKAEACKKAGTIHLGGSANEIIESEQLIWEGKVSEKPFVILAQQSLFDPTRSPIGMHTGWAYCHVPNGCTIDMTERIESQIERFAPGFRDCILARSSRSPKDMEHYNANNIGGDINGGVQDLSQLFTRPVVRFNPYSTSCKELYICSSSTPPGGGVHGLCGYFAAKAILRTYSKSSIG